MFKVYLRKSVSTLAFSAMAAFPNVASADVTLTGQNGNLVLKGDLIGFDDANYTIVTDLGELIVRREFMTCEGADCPANETDVEASDKAVVLSSGDDRIRLAGDLLNVTDTNYEIETSTGVLTVRREFVDYIGPSCPEVDIQSAVFRVSVPGTAASSLLTAIVGDYAKTKDYGVTQQRDNDSGLLTLLVGDERGLEVARSELVQMESSQALDALLKGETAFAITRERLELKQIAAAGGVSETAAQDLLTETVVGLDAISFVVGGDTSMDVINIDAAGKILNGSVSNWAQVGTADAPINVHMIEDNAGLERALKSFGILNGSMGANVTYHKTAEAFSEAINADPAAFGVAYRSVTADVKRLSLATQCKVFVDNTDFAVQTEEYPLTVRLYKYELSDGSADEFANNVGRFIVTDFGQRSIAAKGLVTQALQIAPMQDQGSRLLSTILTNSDDRVSRTVMKSYISETSTARRISTSLRFVTGNATLDSKAESDLERISQIVRSNEYEGYEVLVFGFSDSFGRLNANLSLSERRAQALRSILLNANRGYLNESTVRSYGAGPIAPVGCNETETGREQNRRVEIWLRPKSDA